MRKSVLLVLLLYVCIGLLNLITVGSKSVFYFSIIIGSVAGLVTLVRILRYPQNITVFSLFSLSILSGYMIGPTVSIIYLFSTHRYSPVYFVGSFAFVGYKNGLSYALASAYFVAALLTLVGSVSKPVFRMGWKQRKNAFDLSDRVLLFSLSIIVFAALWTGDFGYMGVVSGLSGRITVLGGLAGLILPALIPVFAYVVTKQIMTGALSWLYVVLLVLLTLILIITGRRELLFVSIISVIYIAYAAPNVRRIFSLKKVFLNPKKFLAILAIGGVIFVGFYGFYALRVADNQLGNKLVLSSGVAESMQILQNGKQSFYSIASDEAMTRSGTLIEYLGSLQVSSIKRYLYGQCVLSSIINSIPSAILSNKRTLLRKYPCTVEYINSRFNLLQTDSPTTLLTTGYADYGVVGMLLYPVIVAALLSSILVFIRRTKWQLFKLLCLAAILYASIFVEEDLTFYFSTIMDIFIIWLIALSVTVVIKLISPNAAVALHANRHHHNYDNNKRLDG